MVRPGHSLNSALSVAQRVQASHALPRPGTTGPDSGATASTCFLNSLVRRNVKSTSQGTCCARKLACIVKNTSLKRRSSFSCDLCSLPRARTPFAKVALTKMRCVQTQAQVVHGHEVLVTKITVRACILVVAAVPAVNLLSRCWHLAHEQALRNAVAETASTVLKLLDMVQRYTCLSAVRHPAQAKRDRKVREEAPPRRLGDWAQGHCAHDQDTSGGVLPLQLSYSDTSIL